MKCGRITCWGMLALLCLAGEAVGGLGGMMGGLKGHHHGSSGAVELLLATGILAKLLNIRAKHGGAGAHRILHALMSVPRYTHARHPSYLRNRYPEEAALEAHASIPLAFPTEQDLLLNEESHLLGKTQLLLPQQLMTTGQLMSTGQLMTASEAQLVAAAAAAEDTHQQLLAARRARKLLAAQEARKLLAAHEARKIIAAQQEARQLLAAQHDARQMLAAQQDARQMLAAQQDVHQILASQQDARQMLAAQQDARQMLAAQQDARQMLAESSSQKMLASPPMRGPAPRQIMNSGAEAREMLVAREIGNILAAREARNLFHSVASPAQEVMMASASEGRPLLAPPNQLFALRQRHLLNQALLLKYHVL